MPTATGYDFDPLPYGNVLIEFFTYDGHTINEQIVTAEIVRRMPVVAALLDVALRRGPDVASEIMEKLNTRKENHYAGS